MAVERPITEAYMNAGESLAYMHYTNAALEAFKESARNGVMRIDFADGQFVIELHGQKVFLKPETTTEVPDGEETVS